ncbi:VWA domain-containing protein [Rhodobacteraceae bacterium ASV31]|nr:VWA domain-containing protein [Anianabacter salinae]
MVVFDGSGSMAENGVTMRGGPRISDARAAIQQAMPQVAPLRDIGLIVYGPGARPPCENIRLHFAPRPAAAGPIILAIDALAPFGTTPLTQAVETAAEVLDFRAAPGVVVLVTDGKETCGGDPCASALRLRAEAADLTIHVVGFRVRAEYFDWESGAGAGHLEAPTVAECMAEITGGTYTSTETVGELIAALNATLGCPLIGRLERSRTAG